MAGRVHVFAGPTLSGRDVRGVLPDAVVHPPATAGDLVALAVAPGDTVVLVDGALAAGRAVRHKEILGLLGQGVEVWGAGGIGALRAAELQSMGMRAHGRVARLFARGVLDGDDEVAVLHDGPDGRWTARSVALVDLRAACRLAHRRGWIDCDTATAVVAVARDLPWRRRAWEEILGRAVEDGLDAELAWRVEQAARDHSARLTRSDALGCLEAVRAARSRAPRPLPRLAGVRLRGTTVYARRWPEQRAGSTRPGAGFVGDVEVLTFCRVLGVDYPALQRRVAVRTLAAGSLPTARPSEREGQAMLREFAEAQRLDPGALPLWLAERGLRRDELLAHLRREAGIRALLQSRQVHPGDQPAADAVLAGAVADHARRRGFVAEQAARGWERAWLSAAELESLSAEERIVRLAARSFHCAPGVDWRAPLLQELKVRGAFRIAREGVAAAQQRWLDVQAADPALAAECRDPEQVLAWATQRWAVLDRLDLALLDRGLQGPDELVAVAPRLVALERSVSTYSDLHCLGQPATMMR
jgi:hypothetical protein